MALDTIKSKDYDGNPVTVYTLPNAPQKTDKSVAVAPARDPTYGAAIANLAVASGATDFFTLSGSDTKTVDILGFWLAGLASSLSAADILIMKRSTGGAGGTSSLLTAVPFESSDVAATAAARAYTANPSSVGTPVGLLAARKIVLNPAATPGNGVGVLIAPPSGGKGWTLRGSVEFICLNFNAAAIAGVSLSVEVAWRER